MKRRMDRRLLAVYHIKKKKHLIDEVARQLGVQQRTVRAWLRAHEALGPSVFAKNKFPNSYEKRAQNFIENYKPSLILIATDVWQDETGQLSSSMLHALDHLRDQYQYREGGEWTASVGTESIAKEKWPYPFPGLQTLTRRGNDYSDYFFCSYFFEIDQSNAAAFAGNFLDFRTKLHEPINHFLNSLRPTEAKTINTPQKTRHFPFEPSSTSPVILCLLVDFQAISDDFGINHIAERTQFSMLLFDLLGNPTRNLPSLVRDVYIFPDAGVRNDSFFVVADCSKVALLYQERMLAIPRTVVELSVISSIKYCYIDLWDRQKQIIKLLAPYLNDEYLANYFVNTADLYDWQKQFISIEMDVEKYFLHKRKVFDELEREMKRFHCSSFLIAPYREDLQPLAESPRQYHSFNNLSLELEEYKKRIDQEQSEVNRRLKIIRRFFWERLQILSTETSVGISKKMDTMTQMIIIISLIALVLAASEIYIGWIAVIIASWVAHFIGIVVNVLEWLAM